MSLKMPCADQILKAAANLEQFAITAPATIELIAAADGQSDKRPTFSIVAYNGGLLHVPMYYRPVVVDLAGLRAGRVTVLKDHDSSQIVGQGTAKITSRKVTVDGQVTGDYSERGEAAYTVVAHAKNGFEWSASVGVQVERLEDIEPGAKVKVNGQTFVGPIGVVRAGRLGEVSFVGIGADETASVKIAATAARQDNQKGLMMDKFKKWLTARGLDFDGINEDKRFELHAEFVAASVVDDPVKKKEDDPVKKKEDDPVKKKDDDPVKEDDLADPADVQAAAIRSATAAEITRCDAIQTVCGTRHLVLAAKAVSENWSIDKAELEVMKADRPPAPTIHASADLATEALVLEAAVLAGAPSVNSEKMFEAPVLEAAHKRFGNAGLAIGELMLLCASQVLGRTVSFRRDGMKEILQAAFSTQGLSGILSNLANKFLLAGYTYGDDSDLVIAATRSVNDFKQISSYRMTGNSEFVEVGPDGEIKHGTLSEDTYNNQAKTYGIMYGITRQQIINDDLSAFDRLQKVIGQGAAHKRRSVVWTEFMDNASFFAGGNSNWQTGAGTALSMASLTAAEKLMLDQQDANGQPISVFPKLLVVPTALSGTAMGIYKSAELRNTTASTKYPIANIHADKYQPIVSTYLGNSSFSGYSATKWYLLADPNELPTIEVCYLNGMQQPTIETADADFNTLGIQLRGYFDFGVAKQDPKGGVGSNGA